MCSISEDYHNRSDVASCDIHPRDPKDSDTQRRLRFVEEWRHHSDENAGKIARAIIKQALPQRWRDCINLFRCHRVTVICVARTKQSIESRSAPDTGNVCNRMEARLSTIDVPTRVTGRYDRESGAEEHGDRTEDNPYHVDG
jgi:hypothetical protein